MDVINMGTEEDTKEVNVGASLNEEIKKILIEILCDYADVFA